ncbi:MAG: peptidase U32 family protein [Desulfosoma sp.]
MEEGRPDAGRKPAVPGGFPFKASPAGAQGGLDAPPPRKLPELLAPAGHLEALWAAVESGADAVYVGLKKLSARAHAANFTLDELARLLPFTRSRGVALYTALNSVITASEVPSVLDVLQALSDLAVDAVIVQDPGIFLLCRRYFPSLKVHASTLAAVHNSAGVNVLERLGARRIVLARELTLEEIRAIRNRTQAELEIFVHGALCYSFSGLCLASSFRGGHSGLQGRCVQPCRLRFTQGRKSGYFFSCNDLCALDRIPTLKRLGLTAFKIEGRMKDAEYIATVVRAYRHVMDAPDSRARDAVEEAREWLTDAPARRLTDGFLGTHAPTHILSPHRSGSSGLWVATVKSIGPDGLRVDVRHAVRTGDRLRPESSEEKESPAVIVEGILGENGTLVEESPPQGPAVLTIRGRMEAPPDARLFRIGRKPLSLSKLWQQITAKSPDGSFPAMARPFSANAQYSRFRHPEALDEEFSHGAANVRRLNPSLWIKIRSLADLGRAMASPAQKVWLTASRENLEKMAKRRLHDAQKERFGWALPPVLFERDEDYYRKAVAWYISKGYRSWEINNWGHLDWFFPEAQASLTAGSRMNIRNKAAMAALGRLGCRWTVLSWEITREELRELIMDPVPTVPVVPVYGRPPLFLSRIHPPILEDRPVKTPRGETYIYRKEGPLAALYADRPVNWFEKIPDLQAMGYRTFLMDMGDVTPTTEPREWERLLSGYLRQRADAPYSLFNYDRKPIPEGARAGDPSPDPPSVMRKS